MKNKQADTWCSEFGRNYTDRCKMTPDQYDELYTSYYGITRTELNKEFIGNIDRSVRVLEVGTNVGNQLKLLFKMGFRNLYGIELQFYPIKISQSKDYGISLLQGSVFEIPFKDSAFDIVFTSGILTHIDPDLLPLVLKEIYRCARRYIWGFEPYNENLLEVPYRDKNKMMWKADYAAIYQDYFPDLNMIKKKNYMFLENDNNDCMFLLEKSNG
jgi:pseudaminic acid biosynthesis-associated methylase